MKRLSLIAFLALGCTLGIEQRQDRACPPQGTSLTYQNFGHLFLDRNCQGCHGRAGDSRNGAPTGVGFATRQDAQAWADRIYMRSAANNTSMPPGPLDPAAEDREKLAEWLACGAP